MQIVIKTYNVNWAHSHGHPRPEKQLVVVCWSSICTSVANDPKRNVFKARKMFYKVVQYTYIKDVPFTLHHLTKTKAKELLLVAHQAGV